MLYQLSYPPSFWLATVGELPGFAESGTKVPFKRLVKMDVLPDSSVAIFKLSNDLRRSANFEDAKL